jgi:hypothetical protein
VTWGNSFCASPLRGWGVAYSENMASTPMPSFLVSTPPAEVPVQRPRNLFGHRWAASSSDSCGKRTCTTECRMGT